MRVCVHARVCACVSVSVCVSSVNPQRNYSCQTANGKERGPLGGSSEQKGKLAEQGKG